MASGYGLNGGVSRCFPFWQDLLGCYVINSAEGETGKKKCLGALDDYYECLHHKKEAARMREIQTVYRKSMISHAREGTPRAEQMSPLGLLDKEGASKA